MNVEGIIARHIAVHYDDVIDLIEFSERANGDGRCLILQRSNEFDEQDRVLRIDKIHVRISGESGPCYGGGLAKLHYLAIVWFFRREVIRHALRKWIAERYGRCDGFGLFRCK